MSYSYQRATSDGTMVALDISITYLDRSEITVYFNDVLTTDWIWSGTSDRRVLFPTPVPNGTVVMVKRTTDASQLRHEFSRGAQFTAPNLDADLQQALHMAQEAGEANLVGDFFTNINLHGFRLVNIGTAEDDTDALTLGQYKADADGAYAASQAALASVVTIDARIGQVPASAGTPVADSTSILQTAFNTGFAGVLPSVYNFATALRVPNLAHIAGVRAGIGFVGTTANVKTALHKTTNDQVAIENFETHTVSNIDCLLYSDPVWIDNGVASPQKSSIERISLQGRSTAQPNAAGIYFEQGGDFRMRDVDITNVVKAIWGRPGVYGATFSQVRAFGEFYWEGGTSLHLDNVRCNGASFTRGGYDIRSTIYTVLSATCSDNATGTAFKFLDSSVVGNGCGCENATADLADHGTALHVDATVSGNSNVIFNGFDIVPYLNQTTALVSVGRRSRLSLNGGTSYFPSIATNCPDLYVFGNSSVVVIRDRVFLNGTYDTPVIQFKAGVTTSRVIVWYGDKYKVYTSTGSGDTVVEFSESEGTGTPTLTFAGVAATLGPGSLLRWKKAGKIVHVSFRLVIQAMGAGAGVAVLGGFPTTYAPRDDAALRFSVINALNTVAAGSTLVGNVTAGSGGSAVLSLRSNTGDTNATNAAFQVGTVLWGDFTYTIS